MDTNEKLTGELKAAKVFEEGKNFEGKTSDFEIEGLNIKGVDTNPNEWKIIKDESYRPDKNAYVLKRFKSEFQNLNDDISNADKCYKLASRNKGAKLFLTKVNTEYAAIEKAPTYYRDNLSESEYDKVVNKISKLREINVQETQKLKQLNDEYKKQCDKEREANQLKRDKIENDVNLIILALTSDQLPLTLSMAIESYSPTEGTSVPSKKQYATELMVNYKQSLLKACKGKTVEEVKELIDFNLSK